MVPGGTNPGTGTGTSTNPGTGTRMLHELALQR